MKRYFSNKFIAILIAGIFLIVTFACFTLATNEAHSDDMGAICETVMNLTDNTIIHTGFILLLVLAAAWLSFNSRVFVTQFKLDPRLTQLYIPPPNKQSFLKEYSYLLKLFSSGIIHPKLHSVVV